MDEAVKRLPILLDGILDSTCSDAQRREFAGLVEQNPDLIPPLIEQMRTHSLLQWLGDEVKPGPVQTIDPPACLEVEKTGDRRLYHGKRATLAAALAASIVLGAAAILWSIKPTTENSSPANIAAAEIVDEMGVVWPENAVPTKQGRAIFPGRLEFEAGELTLRFRSGATVTFRGASSIGIESDMLVRLDRGQATAQVPNWAKGFTIQTADVQVVDLGTQFGVASGGNGVTDVVIFEGEVDVKPTGGDRAAPKRLTQGQAARINSEGAIHRIVEVRGDTKNGWSTTTDSGAPRSLFASIRDNIPADGGTDYLYFCQVTPAGLQEDAPAYVDRHPHQWNGLTADGLPKFLLGADYCRTFNDYRYISNFEVVVQLAKAANLYVFFDDRVPTPAWLPERFENTGVKIGLDEGPAEGIPDHRTAVGPGNSIDNVFTVWRRRCEAGEVVKIGGMEARPDARAMYGIAAKALDPTDQPE